MDWLVGAIIIVICLSACFFVGALAAQLCIWHVNKYYEMLQKYK